VLAVVLPTAGAAAYFALFGCAPAAMFRPVAPFPEGQTVEVGIGGVISRHHIVDPGSTEPPPREPGDVTPESTPVATTTGTEAGASAQFWFAAKVASRLELGFLGHVGDHNAVGAGAHVRWWWLDDEEVRLGLDGQLGFLWAGAGLPATVKLGSPLWLYIAPGLQVTLGGPRVVLPAGLSFSLGTNLSANLEVGTARLLGNESVQAEFASGIPFFHAGLSLSLRW
jgi:hypothetical protein